MSEFVLIFTMTVFSTLTVFMMIPFSFHVQASLMINPAALLPGAASNVSGTYSSSSGVSSSSLSPSPVSTPIGAQAESEGGVSFETPVQVTTLQSAHKVGLKSSTGMLGVWRFFYFFNFCSEMSSACLHESLYDADSSKRFFTSKTPNQSSKAASSSKIHGWSKRGP